MGWNILLAIVPIVLARLLQMSKSRFLQTIILFMWLIFLPNTLYMITDVIHIFNPRFSQMTMPFWILGLLLYFGVFILAVYTFILSIRPVLFKYQVFLKSVGSWGRVVIFLLFSALVGFAISMGRFQRTNTWYIFTQPFRVIRDVIDSLSDGRVMIVAIFYSIAVIIITYFSHKETKIDSVS